MKRLISLLVLIFVACQGSRGSPTPLVNTPEPVSGMVTRNPSATTVPPSSTLPEQYTIEFLRGRTYGGGSIEVIEKMEETNLFIRYLIRYPSDGLQIYGFANVPKGEGPFPVIVAIHGFVDPAIDETLDYTTPAIDRLTGNGYILLHPDLRGYGSSDQGGNLFRVGMSIDVLNLIALIKGQAGPSELFASSAPEQIGLLGHSMGGSIALRVLTISPDVKATVLYASMGGDEIQNAQVLFKAFPDPAFQAELEISPEAVERVSPMNYYSDITSPIQLHHGTQDETIPQAWAEETCAALNAAGVSVECIYYPEEDHTFRGRVADEFYGNMVRFYDMYLSP